jgi:phospholipid-transporting ATPase
VCFILGVTAIKDGFEDFMRYLGDRAINTTKFTCVRNGKEVSVASADLKVGDIIKIESDCPFPCDLLLVSSSKDTGICFVSTLNLNGESNLKLHHARDNMHTFNTPEKLSKLSGYVSCEKPRFELEILNAKILIDQEPEETVSIKNILLRGSILKNTEWIYGIILYTGKHTKLSLNAKKPKFKLSLLDKKLNKFMVFIMLLHLTLDISMVVAYTLYQVNYSHVAFYLLGYNQTPDFVFVLYACFTVFISNNLLIPMSLFVSLEFIKAFQARFMNWDVNMSHKGKRMVPNTSNLNEDLSQIEFIFCDKTGTLTENLMEFNKCSIGADIIHDEKKDPGGLAKLYGSDPYAGINNPKFASLTHFLYCISLCHTINPEFDAKANRTTYDGSSIDEVALIHGTVANGFVLTHRTQSDMTLKVFGHTEVYKILEVIEFNSDRKRMTMVVECPDESIRVYIKGADNVISKILKKDDTLLDVTIQNGNSFAQEGLRTLFFGWKKWTKEEYNSWASEYKEASAAIENRKKLVEKVIEKLECGFDLIGASAIEDLLQDQVPETIEFFRQAGCQVWVLTGDKRDTAVSIGKSSRLLTHTTIEAHINGETPQQVVKDLMACIDLCQTSKDVAIILDTDSLRIAFKEYQELLVEAIRCVKCAICCRVTPLQKSLVVRLVQRKFKKIGLAIGDGANDVSMISEATVGVGIMGREGSQAARSADYAIPRFKHLKRLVAVHGRYSLVRNSYFIQYSFYKNMNLTFVSGFFNAFCLFTFTSILDGWFLNLYNTIFNLLFPIGIATFERDYDEKELESNPAMYSEIKKGLGYRMNWATFATWVLQSVYHSIIIFFFLYGIQKEGQYLENAIDDLFVAGLFIGFTVHMINLKKAILETVNMNILIVFAFVISYILFFCWYLFYCAFPIFELDGHSGMYDIMYFSLAKWKFWFYMLLTIVTCLAPDILYQAIRREMLKDNMQLEHDEYMRITNRQKIKEEKVIPIPSIKV